MPCASVAPEVATFKIAEQNYPLNYVSKDRTMQRHGVLQPHSPQWYNARAPAIQPDTQKPFRMIRMRSSVVALKLTPSLLLLLLLPLFRCGI